MGECLRDDMVHEDMSYRRACVTVGHILLENISYWRSYLAGINIL